MKRKLLGGLLVVAILATAGIVAAQVNTTEASAKSPAWQAGIPIRDGSDAEQSESTSKPFVGIAITSAPEDSDIDGALIVRVVEGSPADGNLQADDIIAAVDDESVSGPDDVVRHSAGSRARRHDRLQRGAGSGSSAWTSASPSASVTRHPTTAGAASGAATDAAVLPSQANSSFCPIHAI